MGDFGWTGCDIVEAFWGVLVDDLEWLAKFSEERWEGHQREHENLEKSLDLARENVSTRLDGMNEFRRQITEAETKFVTRPELDGIKKQISQLERLIWIATGAVMVIVFLLNYMNHKG